MATPVFEKQLCISTAYKITVARRGRANRTVTVVFYTPGGCRIFLLSTPGVLQDTTQVQELCVRRHNGGCRSERRSETCL